MSSMFSKSLENVIRECYQSARELRHEYMGPEDLLLALLDDEEVRGIIAAFNGDLAVMKSDLIRAITENSKVLAANDERDTQPTLGFQRVLQRAVYHVQSSGGGEVSPIRVLVAIYGEKDSFAVEALKKQDIHRLDVVSVLWHGMKREPLPSSAQTIDRIKESTPAFTPTQAPPTLRVFISYCHNDARCLDRLLVHLKPLERMSKIDAWSDKRIRAGAKWKVEIANNIEAAVVAVLLVSADFLASDFIADHEIPPLLLKAEATGTRIIPVILKPCGFHRNEVLSGFQCINDPKYPLLGLGEIDQEHIYEQIASEIHSELVERGRHSIAGSVLSSADAS